MSETMSNCGYGSGAEETASLLVKSPPPVVRSTAAAPPPGGGGGQGQGVQSGATPSSSSSSSGKPVLTRQDCTTSLIPYHHYRDLRNATPTLGSSDDSGPSNDGARSVPDIELHCRYLAVNRCQCQRRKSHCISRSVSRESVRGGCVVGVAVGPGGGGPCGYGYASGGGGGGCGGGGGGVGTGGVGVAFGGSGFGVGGGGGGGGGTGSAYGLSLPPPPPVLLTTSPSSRIIRQSSQPEATGNASVCTGHCCHMHHQPSSSLRQLRDPADNIAMIAADSLRINGAIRQFRQVGPPIRYQFSVIVPSIFVSLPPCRPYRPFASSRISPSPNVPAHLRVPTLHSPCDPLRSTYVACP